MEKPWLKYVYPSGKLTVCYGKYGKEPFLLGKSTTDGPFSIAMSNNQRVTSWKVVGNP